MVVRERSALELPSYMWELPCSWESLCAVSVWDGHKLLSSLSRSTLRAGGVIKELIPVVGLGEGSRKSNEEQTKEL
uniref:Uncharacterized protein n=1 Tax=Fagus sylvatica TaxID=28930 RepID=A0A2N9GUN0_FAGSY